jgi:Ca2+-binding EF-hand superfamily protein
MDIMKEKRKIHMTKVAHQIFKILDKNQDGRISHDEFLEACAVSAEVIRARVMLRGVCR